MQKKSGDSDSGNSPALNAQDAILTTLNIVSSIFHGTPILWKLGLNPTNKSGIPSHTLNIRLPLMP